MVIVTDCAYRSSIAVIYALKALGENFVAVTTDKSPSPPVFASRYVKDKRILSSDRETYSSQLLELCREYENPVIFPVGVFTLNIISENREEFEQVADFCVADKSILDILNDKKQSKELAVKAGLRVPGSTNAFPMVVKPYCGEKFGLRASDRYRIVKNEAELKNAVEHFSKYDDSPIVEEYVNGIGAGVSVVIGKRGKTYSAFCHMRQSEYPSSGGPSSSLVTFSDTSLVNGCVNMLASVGFEGIAMLEFKKTDSGFCFLEVNPRVWGSFGATYKTGSDFVRAYLCASRDEDYQFTQTYKQMKVKFVPNIFASVISYAKAKRFRLALKALSDALNPFVPNAIFNVRDPMPAIRDAFRKRR